MSYLKQEHNISLLAWLRHKKSTGFYITFDSLIDSTLKDTTIDII